MPRHSNPSDSSAKDGINLATTKRKDSGLKFKKQFSRVSTGATNPQNVHDTKHQISVSKNPASQNFDRLKSIEKINEERVQLIGLKS